MAKRKQQTEEQVAEYIDRLGEQRARIDKERATQGRKSWATSGRLELPGWAPLTIQVERRVDLMVYAIGQLNRLTTDMMDYGVEPDWDGYPIADWVEDLLMRVRALSSDDRLRKIERLESSLKPLLTESQRRENRLSALSGELAALLD